VTLEPLTAAALLAVEHVKRVQSRALLTKPMRHSGHVHRVDLLMEQTQLDAVAVAQSFLVHELFTSRDPAG
jgi:hypothetical protein